MLTKMAPSDTGGATGTRRSVSLTLNPHPACWDAGAPGNNEGSGFAHDPSIA
jgi:hypothetical protein